MSPTYTLEPDGTEVYRFAPGELEARQRAVAALDGAVRDMSAPLVSATTALMEMSGLLREQRARERARRRARDRSRRNGAGASRRPHGRPR